MTAYDPCLIDDFLSLSFRFRPVDATFMGARGYDTLLPPADAGTIVDEIEEWSALRDRVAATAEPEALGDRLDRKLMLSELTHRLRAAEERPRTLNPAWYSGEAAFGIISLLLPQSAPIRHDALVARLNAVPDFFDAGRARLADQPIPRGWVSRAQRECAAMGEFLRTEIRLHEMFADDWAAPARAAADAFDAFAVALAGHPDKDPAAGAAYLEMLIRDVHGLNLSARDAVAAAEAAFASLGKELETMAATIDPQTSWQEQLAGLSELHPEDAEAVLESYLLWDVAAVAEGASLVTPAQEYDLDYRWMAPCFRKVSQALYFLFYRSPPALDPGEGSVYWVTPPGDDLAAFLAGNSTAMVKTIHAVHHGSVGHHTQNTRARAAESRLARLAGTDCAMGLAFLGAGSLIEGWACYVEDLLMEAPGFYTPTEMLLLKQFERRNAASVLVDIKLHLGDWSLEDAMAFYRDEAGFAPARVEGEVIRNSMLPGSRLMYWLGVEGIKTLRRRWIGDVADFHDTLLSYGHVPLAWVGQEMDRAGLLAP